MQQNFDAGFGFIMRPENDGQGFHNDPNDPGGATNHGYTWNTWKGWCALHRIVPTMEEFKALQEEDFRNPYRIQFWNALGCDSLPVGVDIVAFDAAVGSGPGHAEDWLRGVDLEGSSPEEAINGLTVARCEFYATRELAPIYGHGWIRRATDCQALALDLINR